MLKQQWNSLQSVFRPGSYLEYFHQRFSDPESPDSREYRQVLKTFISLCKKRETPLGIVLFPRLVRDFEKASYTYGYLHNRVLEICTQEGITCIDLRSTLAPFSFDYKKLWVNRLDAHPGPLVNRLAAKRLMGTFEQVWLSGVADQ